MNNYNDVSNKIEHVLTALLYVCISAQQITKYEKISPTFEFKSQLRLIKEKSKEMGLTTSRNNNKQNEHLFDELPIIN